MSEVELPNIEELEEIKTKSFTKRVALVTAFYAVILAITALGGNNSMKEKRDPYFDFAEVLLQICIIMASIAILSSSRPVFYFSLVVAVIGAILSFNGFTLLFHVPFLG